jgi:hypothetical protein
LAQLSISNPINILVNKSIESSIFPENLKAAQVYAVNSQKLLRDPSKLQQKIYCHPELSSSLLLFLKVLFGNQNQV